MPQALTTLSNARQYVYQTGDNVTADDSLLQMLISQISGAILSYIQRPNLFRQYFTELRDGAGNQRMSLRNFPVIAVSSVSVAPPADTVYAGYIAASVGSTAQTVPQSVFLGSPGWTIDAWDSTPAGQVAVLKLNGYTFWRGKNNVQVGYTAGYAIQNEAYTLTSSLKYTALQPLGTWGQDDGVTYASSGSSLSSVSSSPATGQYQVTNGVYQFATGDVGAALKLNYSYIPSDIENACIQWIAERYSYRSRLSLKSQSLGGQETASYDLSAVPPFVKQLLNPYMRYLPV